MANLLDAIRQTNQQMTQPQGVTDQTASLQGLLRAKSGKAVGGAAPAASNLGEQQAVTQTNQTLKNQIAPQAEMQAQQVGQQQAQIQQQESQQTQQINQAKKFDNIQNNMQVNNILSEFERGQASLNQAKDQAKLEQVGATLRLQNQQYVDNLQREGDRARLDNATSFRQQYAQAAFDNNSQLSSNNRLNNAILNNDRREFQQQVANMDLDFAWSMFDSATEAAKQQAKWSAISGVATAAIGAASAAGNNSATPAANSGNVAANQQAFGQSSSTPFAPSSSNTGTTGSFSSGSAGSIA